nr:uncharacterized protein LOC106693016 [Halyomorpha halys]
MEKEVLECILNCKRKENAICKVLVVESSPAVEKFRNFLSTVSRLQLRVILRNGRLATRYLISKEAQPNTIMGQQFVDEYDPFRTEIEMYDTILKEMEYLLAEFEDTDDLLWCRMIHYVPYKTIILEDLQARGFNMVDKSFFFDLDHGLMTVHALGKYHALTKVLEERRIFEKDTFKPWYAFNNVQMQQFGLMAFQATLAGIKLHWGPKWTSLVEKVNMSPEILSGKFKELGEKQLSFNVLCHGDCNKNNIMFKYDWNKRPIQIKLIDFQLSFYGSPCLDLNHIMYCCVDPTVRKTKYDLFMKTYHESLCSYLDIYKFLGDKPSLEDIIEGMEAYSFLGYWMFINFYPSIALADEMEKYVDIEKIMSTGGQEGYNFDLYKLEWLKESIGPDFEVFVNKFF